MRVTVELVQARKVETVELPAASSGFDLLRRLGLAPDAHLLVRGDTPMALDEPLVDAEHLLIFAVVSGGTCR